MGTGPVDAAIAALLAPLRAEPASTVLLFDFDGTLSPIVDDPAAAVAAPGIDDALVALSARYRTVGAVSGRPVAFLAERLPPSLSLSGLYGLESLVGGVRVDHAEADRWRPVVATAEARARAAAGLVELDGLRVESKGLSLTLHYRGRPDLADAVEALARALADAHGLEDRAAKMSVELHPPIDSDKGTALEGLAGDAAAVLYAGDDLGDLDAFAALDRLAAAGVATVRLAVGGPELPAAVRDAADLVVAEPAALLPLLHHLAADPTT